MFIIVFFFSANESDTKFPVQDEGVVTTGLTCKSDSPSVAECQLIASRVCLCTDKTNLYADVKENGE